MPVFYEPDASNTFSDATTKLWSGYCWISFRMGEGMNKIASG